jgi:hypothetical protein
VTQRLGPPTREERADEPRDDTTESLLDAPRPRSQDPFGPRRAFYDFVYAARRALAAGGWFDAASAAAVGFLALLCVGLVFLLAARLQYPDIGAGTSPWSVLTSIVLLALGSLRVPIHVGDLTITALPLGAVVLSALAVSWAVEPAIRRREVTRLRARVSAGAKIALPFGLICCAAALVFRFRGGATPTSAGAWGALFLGILWGALFGALGGLRSHGPVRMGARSVIARVRMRAGRWFAGLETGALMLGFALVAAAAGGLVWVIVGLLRGSPVPNFGAGDAVAGFVYLMAFLPNVLVAIVAIAMGAPLDVGAQVSLGGRQIGPLKTVSLLDWGGGMPWLAYALVVIPVVALVGAGYAARRSTAPRRALAVVPLGAVVFAAVVAFLSWVGQARLGAGIVRSRGFAVVAADPVPVLALGFVWALVGGLVGWTVAERKDRKEARTPETDGSRGETA